MEAIAAFRGHLAAASLKPWKGYVADLTLNAFRGHLAAASLKQVRNERLEHLVRLSAAIWPRPH
jgi:hypothetical protein